MAAKTGAAGPLALGLPPAYVIRGRPEELPQLAAFPVLSPHQDRSGDSSGRAKLLPSRAQKGRQESRPPPPELTVVPVSPLRIPAAGGFRPARGESAGTLRKSGAFARSTFKGRANRADTAGREECSQHAVCKRGKICWQRGFVLS